jgi:hypothetical protein
MKIIAESERVIGGGQADVMIQYVEFLIVDCTIELEGKFEIVLGASHGHRLNKTRNQFQNGE